MRLKHGISVRKQCGTLVLSFKALHLGYDCTFKEAYLALLIMWQRSSATPLVKIHPLRAVCLSIKTQTAQSTHAFAQMNKQQQASKVPARKENGVAIVGSFFSIRKL